jgi:tRNA-Thr(GGU) m(6)t(6)A37 methyltransferase TsaA
MGKNDATRGGETAISLPAGYDDRIYFIGRIRTPFKTRGECPKNTAASTAIGRVEVDPRYGAGLKDLDRFSHIHLLYWMHDARRDLILQRPAHLEESRGVFALRSPVRPNPIALAAVELIAIEGMTLVVRNVDCVDGTPLIDIKPYFASTDAFPLARRP